MKLDLVKNFFKSGLFQPILTVILIGFLLVFAFQFLKGSNNQNTSNTGEIRQLTQKVTFDDAVTNYLNGTYNVLTNGSLYVRTNNSTITVTPALTSTPTPSVTEIPIVENKYDNIFFIINNGELKRIDARSYGNNSSLFFNRKGEIVFLDNTNKKYSLYPVPADTEKDAVTLFSSTNLAFKEKLFPLSALIKDYQDKKFNPIERAYNVYSGKWQNAIYTDGRTVDVVLQTDPLTGVFSAMFIASSNPPSTIYFDFRKLDSISNYDVIAGDYEKVDIPTKYKTKD